VITGRQEAIDLFRKWSIDKSLVRCQGSFSNFAFSSNGRILVVTDEEIRMMSDDTKSEVVVSFAPEMHFGYADSRNVTGVAKNYDSCLMIFFGPIPADQDPDSISFAAVAEGFKEELI
jgi:hypothetical protein